MKNCLLTVISLSWWNVFLAQDYVIRRRRGNDRPDTFIVPTPPCSGDGSAQCAAMNGTKTDIQCKCVCNKPDKSTFGVYDNTWKCASNTKVRNNGGCSIFFENENSDSPITTIVSLRDYKFQNWNSGCRIASSSYASCNGKWKDLNQQTSLFRFFLDEISPGKMYMIYYTDSAAPNLSGRIFRLGITCTSQQQRSADCVLFKIQGKLNCSISFSSSSTLIQPTASISFPLTQLSTSTSSTPKLPSTSLHVQQMKTLSRSQPTISAASTIPVSTVPTSTTVPFFLPSTLGFPTTNQNFAPSETSTEKRTTDQYFTKSKIGEDSKKSASKGKDSSGMIAGALAGVIGLAIIVISIIVVMKKRKKRDAASPSKNIAIAENPGYGRGEDNSLRFTDSGQQSPYEDEYSYAYTNAAPFVKTNKQETESHANNDSEPGSSVANQVYGNTEELNQKASAPYNEAPVYNTLEEAVYAKVDTSRKKYPSNSDAPIYNTIEEPEYANVDKSQKNRLSENHNEPLYNVLPGPETGDSTLEGLSEEPPCCQVLEGPFSEGAPVYDVLEGPESDEAPVYEALEGQDPRIYGALDMPDIQGSPEEDRRGYDDMVYDSVGDVINDQGDIYQELNQSGQPNSDVYQALNYPDKTIYLNELNQTHSSA